MKTTNNNSNGRQGRPISNGVNKTCKDYEMDLMHKASGELQYIKDKEALEKHLKICPACRKTLQGFLEVDTFAAVTREPSKQFQDKIADLKKRAQKGITCLPDQASNQTNLPPPIDTVTIVGTAAKKIYECLKTSGPLPLPVLRQHTGLMDYPFYEALDRLDCEHKVIIRGRPDQPQYAELRKT